MPITINGEMYYRTAEACRAAGITKNTYLRWIAKGDMKDVLLWDRRGWRLFSEKELEILIEEVNKTFAKYS